VSPPLFRRIAGGGRPLLAIVGGSLALKLLLVWMVAEMPCSHDQCDYLDLADGILAGEGLRPHDGYLWSPGLPYFLALCRGLLGQSLTPPRILLALASTATVPLIFFLGWRLYDRRAGLAAAAVFAFYPTLVAFTHYLWPASIYIFWFVLGFALLVRSPATSLREAVAAGLCLGVAALFKGMALLFVPLAALWLLWRGGAGPETAGPAGAPGEQPAAPVGTGPAARARWVVALGLIVASLLPVLPWTARNWVTHQRFLLVDATSGRNLYIGTNVPPPSNWDYGFDHRRRVHGGRPRCSDENVVDRDRCEIRNGLSFIASHPGLMLARIPLKMADLLNPSSFLIRHARLGKYPHSFAPWEIRLLTLVTALTWMGVAVLGWAGLVLLPGAPGRRLLILLLAYHLAIHAVTFGMTRFRLPMVPFLVIAAAPLLTRSWRPLLAGVTARRAALAAGGVLVLVLLWASRWRQVFDVFLPGR
jgi:hypothetical protein